MATNNPLLSGSRTPEQRLNIIIGQLNGLKKAIGQSNYECSALITQIKAVKAGLDAVLEKILEEQLDRCLKATKAKPEVKKIFNQVIR
ncbi:MAG TPA: metal-sensitive transcriptional regulator [bacterium]|jgi:DNA-binding FrmR family transcriptional regulator|nr:metal-sensitive transcriptional regulator [bacterium]